MHNPFKHKRQHIKQRFNIEVLPIVHAKYSRKMVLKKGRKNNQSSKRGFEVTKEKRKRRCRRRIA